MVKLVVKCMVITRLSKWFGIELHCVSTDRVSDLAAIEWLRSQRLTTGYLVVRERPFDFQGGGGFEKNILALIFVKKNILASTQTKKNSLTLGMRKKITALLRVKKKSAVHMMIKNTALLK